MLLIAATERMLLRCLIIVQIVANFQSSNAALLPDITMLSNATLLPDVELPWRGAVERCYFKE